MTQAGIGAAGVRGWRVVTGAGGAAARRSWIVASGVLAGTVLAAGSAADPRLGLAVLAVLALVPIALGPPAVGVAALAALLFVQRLPAMGPAVTLVLLLTGARWWAARRGRAAPPAGVAGERMLAAALVGLVLWLGLSLSWARHAAAGEPRLVDWALAAALFGVVATSITQPRHVLLVLRAFVAGAVASVTVGLASAALAAGSTLADLTVFEGQRLQGGAGDPNFLAAGLVPAIALAAGLLAAARERPVERSFLVAALVVLVAGLGATQSRGGVLAAAITALAAVALAGRGRGRAALGVGTIAALAVAALAISPGGLDRITSPDPEGDGRADLWQVATRMVSEHPLAGVGLGNFPVRAGESVRAPGSLEFVELVAERPHEAHNTYLQLLAEAGPLGLLAFLLVVGIALRAARRAERRLAAQGDEHLAVYARAVVLAGIAMLGGLVFITNGDDLRLWLLLGLGPALLRLAAGAPRRAA
jgi:O-antigen ligase